MTLRLEYRSIRWSVDDWKGWRGQPLQTSPGYFWVNDGVRFVFAMRGLGRVGGGVSEVRAGR